MTAAPNASETERNEGRRKDTEPRGEPPPPAEGNRLVGPAFAVLAGSLAALAGTLAVRVVLARSFTAEEVGVLLLAMAVVSAAGGVAGLGLNPAAARRIAQLRSSGEEETARAIARGALGIATLTGLAAAAAVFLAAPRLGLHLARPAPATFAVALRALSPVAFALPVGIAVVGVCRGFGRVAGRALIRDGGGGALRAAGVTLAAVLAASLPAVGVAYSAAVVATEVLFLAHGARQGWFGSAATLPVNLELLPRLPPFAALDVLQQARQWMDLLVVGLFAAPRDVAYYGLARGLTRALELVRTAPLHGFLPAAAAVRDGAAGENLAEVYTRTRLVALALVWGPLMLCLLAPEALTLLLFGEAYRPAADLLRILSCAVLSEALLGYKDQTLLALGAERTVVTVRTLTTALSLATLLVLVPPLGVRGAAVGLLLTELLRDVVFAVVLRRKTGLRLRAHDFPPPVRRALLLAAAALGLLLVGFPADAWVSGAVALVAGSGGTLLLLRAAGGSFEGWRRFLAS